METVVLLTVTALQISAVYILFSLGLTLIFGVMRIVNFAYGHLFALSALVVAIAMPWLAQMGVPVLGAYALAVVAGILAAMALGLLTYVGGYRFFKRDMVGSFILSIGLVLLLDGIFLEVFSGAVRPVPEIMSGTVSVLGAPITAQHLALGIAALLVTALLFYALTMTKLGKALRAVSTDHEAAMLQGVPYNRIAFVGFMIASALAALAGALLAPVTIVSPIIGGDYIIKGFIAVIIGGLGSISGAVLGGLFVAVIETLGGYYYDPSTATIAIFTLAIIVLLVRPKGLFGHG